MAGPGETFGSLWALAGGFASQSDCIRVLPSYISLYIFGAGVYEKTNSHFFHVLANNSKTCCSKNLQMVRINLYDFCNYFTFFQLFSIIFLSFLLFP
jgi:hypothetical protein